MRLLHTMLRVGNLQRSIDFYTKVMGMQLLRTTERPEQKYSLAFVGFGRNPEHAEIELTYNHGVDRYELGTAFGHIALEVPDAARGMREDPRRRRQRHPRGRAGQGRHDGDRLRHGPRRLQDRADRDAGLTPQPLSWPVRHSPAPARRRRWQTAREQWGGRGDLWVFGYASLIWRPEFDAVEQRPARVLGFHRALKMRSRVNRGTPERPGLVFALLPGGSCRGVAYRIERDRVDAELERLWEREMPNAVYDARWLPCRTPQGTVQALGFTLDRRSPSFTGR